MGDLKEFAQSASTPQHIHHFQLVCCQNDICTTIYDSLRYLLREVLCNRRPSSDMGANTCGVSRHLIGRVSAIVRTPRSVSWAELKERMVSCATDPRWTSCCHSYLIRYNKVMVLWFTFLVSSPFYHCSEVFPFKGFLSTRVMPVRS